MENSGSDMQLYASLVYLSG